MLHQWPWGCRLTKFSVLALRLLWTLAVDAQILGHEWWGGCSCVDEPCSGLPVGQSLAADMQVPIEAGTGLVNVLRMSASPEEEGTHRYKKVDKNCCPMSLLLSTELALGINKCWKIAWGDQASARHRPQWWWETCFPQPGGPGLGRGSCRHQGLPQLPPPWCAGAHPMCLPAAALLCPLLCTTPNASWEGCFGGAGFVPFISQKTMFQFLWRSYLSYLYAVSSVPWPGIPARVFWIINVEIIHSPKVIGRMLVYSKSFTNFNMYPEIQFKYALLIVIHFFHLLVKLLQKWEITSCTPSRWKKIIYVTTLLQSIGMDYLHVYKYLICSEEPESVCIYEKCRSCKTSFEMKLRTL